MRDRGGIHEAVGGHDAVDPPPAEGLQSSPVLWRPLESSPVLETFWRRFVMIESEGEEAPEEFKVVQNWFEELKRLVPTDR